MKYFSRAQEIIVPLFMAMLVGALAGFGAVFFRRLIEGIEFVFQRAEGGFAEAGFSSQLFHLFLPAVVGLFVGPVITFISPEVRGPGVPEVMESLALHSGHIRHRVTIIKTFVTSILIAAGASVGREGPIVQIGSSIGSSLAACRTYPSAIALPSRH